MKQLSHGVSYLKVEFAPGKSFVADSAELGTAAEEARDMVSHELSIILHVGRQCAMLSFRHRTACAIRASLAEPRFRC